MEYKINIALNNGDRIESNVVAENQAHAIERLKSTPQFLDFIGDNEIVKIDIKPIFDSETKNPERFILQKSKDRSDWWMVTDKKNLITIKFKNGNFNETQEIVPLDDINGFSPLQIAKIIREMADYLIENHREVI